MRILQIYNFFKQIKNTNAVPSFNVGPLHESYTLKTKVYKFITEAIYPNYSIKKPTQYVFTAYDNSTGITLHCNGMLAKIIFSQMAKKAR